MQQGIQHYAFRFQRCLQAGFVVAEIDLGKVAEARKMVPSLTHDRKYTPPVLHKAAIAKAAE